jgi:hypothetical protein
MLTFLADENLHGAIVRGLRRRRPDLDVVRVQDVGLSGADDPHILEWAAEQSRILLTGDVSTLTHHAYHRVETGLRMPGVVEIGRDVPIGQAIEEILLLAECGLPEEIEGRVLYLPLR